LLFHATKESNASVLGASVRGSAEHFQESRRIVQPAACRVQHSFDGFTLTPKSAVITDHSHRSGEGPPLGALYLAPHQRENRRYSERDHDYGESQQIEHEHLPWLGRRLPAPSEHYDRAALSDGVTAVTGVMDFLRLQRRRRFPPARHNDDLAALRRHLMPKPGHPATQRKKPRPQPRLKVQ
jgi:hypothetical protein